MTSVLRFAWADAKAAMRSGLRVFAWATIGMGLMLFIAVLVNPKRVEPLTVGSVVATLIAALAYSALPGLVIAAGAVLFRLAGIWAFVPLVVFPLLVYGVFWLGRGALDGQAQDVWNAFGQQLQTNRSAFNDVRVHTIEALVVVLLLYGLISALQPPVVWQLLHYLLLVAVLTGVALVLTFLVTLPPLLFAVGRRARARYAEFAARSPGS